MNILVSGSAGFIGHRVVAMLWKRGHVVTGVDCLVEQVHGSGDVDVQAWTIGDYARFYPGEWNFDAVVHLAAEAGVGQSQYEPVRYVRSNTMETAILWERIVKEKRIRKVVVASSMSIYGEGEYVDRGGRTFTDCISRAFARGWDAFDLVYSDSAPTEIVGFLTPTRTRESKRPEPASVYGMTKYDQERYSMILGGANSIPTVALRFFNVIGPGQALSNPYTGVVSQFACRALNGAPALVFEDGQQSRDFVYVDDVARAVVEATEKPDLAGVFNVCTGMPTTVLGLAESWCRIAAENGINAPEPQVLGKYRVGDVRHCYGDPYAFNHVTGWEPRVRIDDGLREVSKWIIETKQRPTDRQYDAMREMERAGLIGGQA